MSSYPRPRTNSSYLPPRAGEPRSQPSTPQQYLDGYTTVERVIGTLALAPFIQGAQRYSLSGQIDCVREPGQPASDDPRLVRRHTSAAHDVCLLAGPGWTAVYRRCLQSAATVQAEVEVTAESPGLAQRVLADITATYAKSPDGDPEVVPMGFWHHPGQGKAVRVVRDTRVPPWPDIRENYPSSARKRMDVLAAVDPGSLRGSIVLMHGPPGTGKTTALRSLAHSWRNWCTFEYILDPENLFASPGYLMDAAIPQNLKGSPWRALIMEDCDELLRSDAKRSQGQNLARLLNLSDGILGQGGQTLLVLTTNEDVYRLHPAVIRPGRCLAQIEVGQLSQDEVRLWRDGAAADLAGPATLAELYAHTAEMTQLLNPGAPLGDFTGAYL